MLPLSHRSLLEGQKNLLAFSAGVDSSALFFLLLAHHIPFDIAIVDYNLRPQSKKEVAHAKSLAKQYNITCYSTKAPAFKSHFEQHARAFRYRFFEEIITEYGYDTLLTAHQLNDQLEWLFMRLSKGAGLSELVGLEPATQKQGYTLVRPLLEHSKDALLSYLEKNSYPYFTDESNSSDAYERNRFRKAFSDPFIAQHKEGVARSFAYLRQDKATLGQSFETIYTDKALRVIKLHTLSTKAKAADLTLKELGYLLSAAQRSEIAKEQSLVIGGTWAVEQQGVLLYIAPYLTIDMPKAFKEQCRIAKVPTKIRPYLYVKKIDIQVLKNKILIFNF